MPRPTVAQLAYGSCTVVFSTFAMLLVSRTGSAVGIALVAVVALGLGLLVAMTVPPSGSRPAAARQPAPPEPVRATVPSAAHEPVRERAAS